MNKYLLLLLIQFLVAGILVAQNQDCPCFLISENKGKIELEKVVIGNNKTEIFNDPSIIAPVFSMGEGMNGDMVQKERRGGMIIAQCKDNLLKLKFKNKDGSEKPMPDSNVAELKELSIRINIVGGDAVKKAFMVDHYTTVKEDAGPVIDMFGGKLPVKPGDYIITTETKKPVKANTLTGKASYRIDNGWIVVPVSIGDGKN
ncbi:MAG: hypothetical protein IPL50_19075 [Chitinophagaceae bacterium]|nr:hypothetical protein [Chitinophagaceae bacterium]